MPNGPAAPDYVNRAHPDTPRTKDIGLEVVADEHRTLRRHGQPVEHGSERCAIGLARSVPALAGEDNGVDVPAQTERGDFPPLNGRYPIGQDANPPPGPQCVEHLNGVLRQTQAWRVASHQPDEACDVGRRQPHAFA